MSGGYKEKWFGKHVFFLPAHSRYCQLILVCVKDEKSGAVSRDMGSLFNVIAQKNKECDGELHPGQK